MLAGLPDQLDFWRAVAGRLTFQGDLGFSELPRLLDAVLDEQGSVRFDLGFERDSEGRGTLLATLDAVVELECQRCLGRMEFPVSVRLRFAAVGGVDQAAALPDMYEPLLIEDGLIRPKDLIEDELLLALPLIPRHAAAACLDPTVAAAGTPGDGQSAGPFAVLAEWRAAHSKSI